MSIFHAKPKSYAAWIKALEEVAKKPDPEVNSLNWPAIAPDFDFVVPRKPLTNPFPRGHFQEPAPHNLAIPPGIPMSKYFDYGHTVKSRVSGPDELIVGLLKTQRNVEKVEKALQRSKKRPVDFYKELNMHSKEHAEKWLKNAKKSLSRNKKKMGGGRKTRNARKKSRKVRQ